MRLPLAITALLLSALATAQDISLPDYERVVLDNGAVTPLFRVPVPIFPSELADPEKGTGILMVCTFGDQTDVRCSPRSSRRVPVIATRLRSRKRPLPSAARSAPARKWNRSRSWPTSCHATRNS